MPTYKIKINYESPFVKTDIPDEAIAELENLLAISNATLLTEIIEKAEIIEVCPKCDIELKTGKYNDFCPNCGYNTAEIIPIVNLKNNPT